MKHPEPHGGPTDTDDLRLDDEAWVHAALHGEPIPEDVMAMVDATLDGVRRRDRVGRVALGAGAIGLAGVTAVLAAPGVGPVASALAGAARWWVATDLAVGLVPGAWTTVGLAALLLAAAAIATLATTVPAWARTVAAAFVLAWTTSVAGPAQALELEGDWPDGERVSVEVEDEPTLSALRAVLDAAELDLVASWRDDRRVSIDVEDRPVRDVVRAVLGADAPVVVRREGSLVTVEPVGRAATTAPAPPVAEAPPAHTPKDLDSLEDRFEFGDDIVIARGERVRDVITLGGDVEVAGEARSVVTLGGDLLVRSTGVVHGDVVTAGGEVTKEDGGQIARGGVQFGQRGMVVQGAPEADDGWPGTESWRPHDHALSIVGQVFRSVAMGALLFLLGLVAIGVAPDRMRQMQAGIARSPLRAGAVGVGVALAGIATSVVLFITLIGIPLAFLLLLAGMVLGFFGAAVTASVVGAALPVEALRGRPVAQLAAGVGCLLLLSLIPLVGGLFMAGAVATGLGTFLLTRFGAGARAGRSGDPSG